MTSTTRLLRLFTWLFHSVSLRSLPTPRTTREMVDLWPKERGGHCTWNNEYRKCFKWQVENMDMLGYNYLTGYWGWVRRYGVYYLGALWVADNLGMMSNTNEGFNSLEIMHPIFVESS